MVIKGRYVVFVELEGHGVADGFAEFGLDDFAVVEHYVWVFAVDKDLTVIGGKPDNIIVFHFAILDHVFGLVFQLTLDLTEPVGHFGTLIT